MGCGTREGSQAAPTLYIHVTLWPSGNLSLIGQVKDTISVKHKNIFNLGCEDISRKYVTSYENAIQKKVRRLDKHFSSVQFSSVVQPCLTLCDPMNHSTPGLPVHHQLLEFTQTYVYWIGDAIQPSHPLSSPFPPAVNLSQHQGLFKWVSSTHEVAKVLEFQLQHQSFQWTPRTHLL